MLDLTDFLLKIKQIDTQATEKKNESKSSAAALDKEEKEDGAGSYGDEDEDGYGGGDFGFGDYGEDDFGLDGSFGGDDLYYPDDLGDKNIAPGQSPLHVPEE